MPARFRLRVVHADTHRITVDFYLFGDKLGQLIMRLADCSILFQQLEPEIIIVDRENITDRAWEKLRGYKQVELI